MSLGRTLITSRLEVRPPRELDRARFVELFCNDDFMIFSGQALTEEAATGASITCWQCAESFRSRSSRSLSVPQVSRRLYRRRLLHLRGWGTFGMGVPAGA